MEHYKQLALRYLKINQRRSIITIIGVAVATAVLYVLLNLGWNLLLDYREAIRKDTDYEIVLFAETTEQVEQIREDKRVKRAYIGPYYDGRTNQNVRYENAIYINTVNPYRMDTVFREMKEKYGVDGVTNIPLQIAYLQGDDQVNLIYIGFLSILLISYIFAIFGIGIVRNSIQMSTLEQIKDYGNLRCIGASKRQLKSIVYLEGFILEVSGNILGVFIGLPISMLIGCALQQKVTFRLLPVIPILVAFLFDLFFAMEESCKVIVHMTPVSAIRGEYRIRKEKIKWRSSRLIGKLLGVEGEYAYKNIMRNPMRFFKTIGSIGIGVAATITSIGFFSTFQNVMQNQDVLYKYYPLYFVSSGNILINTMDEVQSKLPSTDFLQTITDLDEVECAKGVYSMPMLLVNYEDYYKHWTASFEKDTYKGKQKKMAAERMEKGMDTMEDGQLLSELDVRSIGFTGYDKEDYKRFENELVEGTLDVSENGIVLINGGIEIKNQKNGRIIGINEFYNIYNKEDYREVTYTDYHVGDTIELIDMERYRTLFEKEVGEFDKRYEEEIEKESKKEKIQNEGEMGFEQKMEQVMEQKLKEEYRRELPGLVISKLIAEDAYKTYTIEGIVKDDVNMYDSFQYGPRFIMPLEHYYQNTGTDDTMLIGMKYHFRKGVPKRLYHVLEKKYGYDLISEYLTMSTSPYIELLTKYDEIKAVFYEVLPVIGFIVLMSTFNIINTTASNLHLRKKEFAQLRVVGVSARQLRRMLMLEGILITAAANLVGVAIGAGIHVIAFSPLYKEYFAAKFYFPIWGVLLSFIVSAIILCGAVYLPLRNLKLNMAENLAAGGE